MTRSFAIFLTVATICLSGSGCQQRGGSGGSPGTSAQVSAPTNPTPAPPQESMRVKRGNLPINYMIASGGNIRILDATSGQELLRQKVAPQTMVSLDATAGVTVGDSRAVKGPLPEDHRYEIWLDR